MNKKILVILTAILAFTLVYFSFSGGSAVVKNEILLSGAPETYSQVRHIVLKGTNEQIGEALASIAKESYGVELTQYASLELAEARKEYMKDNYPILLERMRGVAKVYKADETYDTSALYQITLPQIACSAVSFPPSSTDTGHSIVARNMDFYTAPFSEFLGIPAEEGESNLFSKIFVIEKYPDKGYSSILIGYFDLLNDASDGINSEGVTVNILVDDNATGTVTFDLPKSSGLSSAQLVSNVLDNAANVEEAKQIIMQNKVFMPLEPAHFLITDRSGKSFIAELSNDFQWHFTDSNNEPQIMTNHAVYLHPEINTFPSVPETEEYNTFNRYKTMNNYISSHQGKFTADDAAHAVELVYGNTNSSAEGTAKSLPLRIMWSSVSDSDDSSITVKFYLKDGSINTETNKVNLVMSEPFVFKLQN